MSDAQTFRYETPVGKEVIGFRLEGANGGDCDINTFRVIYRDVSCSAKALTLDVSSLNG